MVQHSRAVLTLISAAGFSNANTLSAASGQGEAYREAMPGTVSPHDQATHRQDSGRSSVGSGRQPADVLSGVAGTHSSSGNQPDETMRDNNAAYM